MNYNNERNASATQNSWSTTHYGILCSTTFEVYMTTYESYYFKIRSTLLCHGNWYVFQYPVRKHQIIQAPITQTATFHQRTERTCINIIPVYSYFEHDRSTRSVNSMPVTSDIHARSSSQNRRLSTNKLLSTQTFAIIKLYTNSEFSML